MEATTPSCAPAVLLSADWQRYLPPRAVRSVASRAGFAALVALFFMAHAGLITALLYEDQFGRGNIAQPLEEEIPVEVIVDPPKEEPKPPPPPPPAPKEQPRQVKEDVEKPATSAPRKAAQTLDTKGIEEKTAAPQATPKPQDGDRAPASAPIIAQAAAAPTVKDTLNAPADAADAEAIGKAGPESPGKPNDKDSRADRKALTSILQQLSTTALSDFSFGRTTKAAPITGGLEDNRYLANVFAKIMSKKQYPRGVAANRTKRFVTISFVLDDAGHVVYQGTSKSSGDAAIDSAAAAAVRLAAPYPPPPYGMPHSLIANIEF
ncbi:MAG: periplasmic protein TonB [Methylobacteriaceae bacterium]|jgi:protein TonB|nr:periplasmic protein TonB [Methylobacteriaceae bacterium]